MSDARFEDGVENPLRLRAEGAEDLTIVSTLIQDAVAQVSEIAWQPRSRRFALLVNRFPVGGPRRCCALQAALRACANLAGV